MENKHKPAFSNTDAKTFCDDGLSKFEYAVIEFHKALLINPYYNGNTSQSVVKKAIENANELFKQLEENG